MAAHEAGKPFLNIIQANTIEKSWRLPNAAGDAVPGFHHHGLWRTRHQLLHLLGPPRPTTDSISDGKPRRCSKPVAALNAEIAQFGPALMQLDSIGGLSHRPAALRSPGSPGRRAGAVHRRRASSCSAVRQGKRQDNGLHGRQPGLPAGCRSSGEGRAGGRWNPGIGSADWPVDGWPDAEPERTVRIQLGPGDGRLFRVTERGARLASPKDTED